MPTAAVIVIGDVGRSPRTANHALSLAEDRGYQVCLIGYTESILNERITAHPNIKVVALPPPPDFLLLLPVSLLCRFVWTAITILVTLLFRVGWSLNLVLVQNPPALPALIVAWAVGRLRGAKFVIDWHNYTWSMLAQRWELEEEALGLEECDESDSVKACKRRKRAKGGKANFVRLTHRLEGVMGRRADAALCVSAAMAADLQRRWGIAATVFYDRPPQWKFGSVSLADKHDLFYRLKRTAGDEKMCSMLDGRRSDDREGERNAQAREDTFFSTRNVDGEVRLSEDRPLILISSTSWTPDEDFSILLDAIVKYEKKLEEEESGRTRVRLPPLFLIITGKGPEKAHYMEKIQQLDLAHISIYSPWLEAADYPTALASADLGVCLHTSTSGVDLPMKVVDMFGCGVPVLAKRFAAIGELVHENENGHLFDSSDDLVDLIVQIARGHPSDNRKLLKLQSHVRSAEGRLASWEETWMEMSRHIF